MNSGEKSKLSSDGNEKETYENATIIPPNFTNYFGLTLLMYKKRILNPKYFILFVIIWSPVSFWFYYASEDLTKSILYAYLPFIVLLAIFPPLFFLIRLRSAKKNPENGVRKFGEFKDFNIKY